VSDPIRILTDLKGRIVEASEGAVGLLGVEERRLGGTPLVAYVAERRRQEFRLLLHELRRGGRPVGASLDLRGRGGGLRRRMRRTACDAGRPELVRQAISNLAANAVAYTVRGEIRLVGRDLGGVAEIEVHDTGAA
jgi:signal transduction histidine kinase